MAGFGSEASGRAGEEHREGVSELVGPMSAVLTQDVRVRLFACSTAADAGGSNEDSLADRISEELSNTGRGDAAVIGHTDSGHTTRNRDLSVFRGAAQDQEGADHWLSDDFITQEMVDGEAARLGIEASSKLREIMVNFAGRDAWLTADLSSHERFAATMLDAWQAYVDTPEGATRLEEELRE